MRGRGPRARWWWRSATTRSVSGPRCATCGRRRRRKATGATSWRTCSPSSPSAFGRGPGGRCARSMYAATRSDAETAVGSFVAEFEAKYPKATACLVEDKEALPAFFDSPAGAPAAPADVDPIMLMSFLPAAGLKRCAWPAHGQQAASSRMFPCRRRNRLHRQPHPCSPNTTSQAGSRRSVATTIGKKLTEHRRYAATSIPLRRNPCSRFSRNPCSTSPKYPLSCPRSLLTPSNNAV